MDKVENNSIQCIITSPPYPMISKWDECFSKQIEEHLLNWTKYDKSKITGRNKFRLQHIILYRVFLECYRVLVDGGIMCINIGDATQKTEETGFCCFPNYARIVDVLFDIGFVPLIPIFWKKITNRPNAFLGSGFLPVNVYISQDCEYIGIFRKGNKLRSFNEEEKNRRNNSKFTKEERDLWCQQIWNIQGERGSKKHSGWPKEIFTRLMRMFSIVGDTILDPFAGRGNEDICSEYGRLYVGYEINAE
jgi:site-specific DNA-methyltransferase (cytosine-N4-specific)